MNTRESESVKSQDLIWKIGLFFYNGLIGHGIKQLQHLLSCNMKIYLHSKIHIALKPCRNCILLWLSFVVHLYLYFPFMFSSFMSIYPLFLQLVYFRLLSKYITNSALQFYWNSYLRDSYFFLYFSIILSLQVYVFL